MVGLQMDLQTHLLSMLREVKSLTLYSYLTT